jgi:hypothetical protein
LQEIAVWDTANFEIVFLTLDKSRDSELENGIPMG